MILGDSLKVMASLAEKEGLSGQVQTIYFDPPYGIKFNSNFQWTTGNRAVKDGETSQITREPEQVKAFRDTWKHGVHSYLDYIRDRLTISRELLRFNGSIFLQIGDENVHLMRNLLDEIFGRDNFVSLITFRKASSQTSARLPSVADYILWYAKDKKQMKFNRIFERKDAENDTHYTRTQDGRLMRNNSITSQTGTANSRFPFRFEGKDYTPPGSRGWSTSESNLYRLTKSGRLFTTKNSGSVRFIAYADDFPVIQIDSVWSDIFGIQSRLDPKIYTVQTDVRVIQRCILMSSDEGDLVLDPTCGSGTTAYVAEQWGRRWIVIDTSRVALALARSRMMAARFPYYKLQERKKSQD